WAANFVLRGIAELSDFFFDLDTRTASFRLQLNGEEQPIEISVDGFVVKKEGDARYLIIHDAQANRPWLNNLLGHVTGRPWNIPDIPQYKDKIELVTELLEDPDGE
ncbi:MAG: hypothetical protein ACU84J_16505, partial [Gammaproteobacteria bacterium]